MTAESITLRGAMGISDDIKPKKSHHPQKRSADVHVPVFKDMYNEKDIDLDNFEPEEKKLDPKSLEQLENDFFDYEYKHDNKRQQEKKDIYIDEAEEKKPASKSHHQKKSSTKATFWLITLALLGLLIWQNYPEIVSAVKNKFFKNSATETVSDNVKDDEYYTGEKVDNTTTEETAATATSTETAQPQTTTTAPTIDKASVVMEVLNGNGVKGSADTIRDQLVTAGFKVSRVANAKNFNYATSIIYFKTGKDTEANLIKGTLTSLQTTTQNSDSIVGDYDVIVVVGAK